MRHRSVICFHAAAAGRHAGVALGSFQPLGSAVRGLWLGLGLCSGNLGLGRGRGVGTLKVRVEGVPPGSWDLRPAEEQVG